MESTKRKKNYGVSEIEVSYSPRVKASERPKVSSSEEASKILRDSWDDSKIEYIETFKVMLLDRSNKVLGILEASRGGISGTVADPKVIFGAALKASASSILLCHNHPSGNRYPSENDRKMTRKMRAAGELLDLPVLDHIIITSEEYYSFADEGFL